jgi:hypothetical protein
MPTALPQDLLRDGDYLVVRQRWVNTLPAGCVVCGAAETGRVPIKIRKASRLLVLFGMFGALIYFIAPAAKLQAGFCDAHRPGAVLRYLFYLVLAGSFGAFFLAAYWAIPEAMFTSGAIVLVTVNFAVIFEILRTKTLQAIHSDRNFVWLAKVSPAMLEQIPEIASPAVPAR